MENVTGILSAKNSSKQLVKDIIIQSFNDVGYTVVFNILNAADFGVPQNRRRVFFIGTKKTLNINPEILFPEKKGKLITLGSAISDLPKLLSGKGEEESKYTSKPKNKYQEEIRKNSNILYNHVAMKHTKRLIERFKQIKSGQSVADVSKEYSAVKRGEPDKKSGKVFSQNNFRVIKNKPCPTLAASFQSNFIHPEQDRNFTAREGARIQSFPDTYRFYGKRTLMSWEKSLSQYNQIGNAVAPLQAKAIAEEIAKRLL
jgi:DNA (cytosine-5)-methyltransferase 1